VTSWQFTRVKHLSYSFNSTIECIQLNAANRVNTQHEKFFPVSSKKAENGVKFVLV